MSAIYILFIIIPIVAAAIISGLVWLRMIRREYSWAVIPLALIAVAALLLTA